MHALSTMNWCHWCISAMSEYTESICLGCNKVTKILITEHWYMKNGETIRWKAADYKDMHHCILIQKAGEE